MRIINNEINGNEIVNSKHYVYHMKYDIDFFIILPVYFFSKNEEIYPWIVDKQSCLQH